MKIVHCLIQYLPDYVAGTEVYTHTLARLQQLKGHQVAVITPHIEHYKPGGMVEHYQYDNIDVHQFLETADPSNRDIYSGKKKPEGLSNFRDLLKRLKPDVIHFHELNRSTGLTIEHVKVARQFGAKVFITMHLSFYSCYTNTLITNHRLCDGRIRELECSACSYNTIYHIPKALAWSLASIGTAISRAGITALLGKNKAATLAKMPTLIRRIKTELSELSNNADKVIAITDWYKNILLLNGVPSEKVAVLKQAVPTISGAEMLQQKAPQTLPLRIAFLGRIQPQKGVHLMLEAARSFSENEVIIDIYGKEEKTEYYATCAGKVATMSNVFLKGMIDRHQVVQVLSGYHLLCLPSVFSEMSPLVIQEAFAAGIPVIASRVYGNMEQIQHGINGLLFNFNSAESLATQLRAAVVNPSLINELRQNVKPPDSFEMINESYLRLYEAC